MKNGPLEKKFSKLKSQQLGHSERCLLRTTIARNLQIGTHQMVVLREATLNKWQEAWVYLQNTTKAVIKTVIKNIILGTNVHTKQ